MGLGLFGSAIARTLASAGHHVLALDRRLELVEAIGQEVEQAVQADGTDRAALEAIDIRRHGIVFVTIGDLASSILCTLVLRELGVDRIYAKINSTQQGRILLRLGAEEVLFPERDMGQRVARQASASAGVTMHIDLAQDAVLQEMVAPAALVGRSLAESDARRRFNVTVVALKRRDMQGAFSSEAIVSPPAETVVAEHDLVLVAGRTEDLARLRGDARRDER
ncbi:MAG: potassium channel family protein [Longimicrobiales bacterium]